jgi:putative restriction endonuclease
MARKRHFGEIDGLAVGQTFTSRKEVAEAELHLPLIAGISGGESEGADSIVMSGGYEDDEDFGDVIIYTGEGGNDPNTKRQVDHQKWDLRNQALRVSESNGLPVRVIRGAQLKSPFAPSEGYRYDGLYFVSRSWSEQGNAGFLICRFELIREDATPPVWPSRSDAQPADPGASPRVRSTIQRIIRNTQIAQDVKEIHEYTCQICGTQIQLDGRLYAEACHIKPLGRPHNGPDVPENILCLCPNCHVRFDRGAFVVSAKLEVRDRVGAEFEGVRIRTNGRHHPDARFFSYHEGLHPQDNRESQS